jgi:hypothetical protein
VAQVVQAQADTAEAGARGDTRDRVREGRRIERLAVSPVGDRVLVTIRAGLHWGATLYIGSIITPGRTEVTALGIDPTYVTYIQLADLDTATDKARRDAPAVPVYDINVTR